MHIPKVCVAFDESNHGRDPEIVVAVWSQIPSDYSEIQVRGRLKHLECDVLKKTLRNEKRGFRFIVLRGDAVKGNGHLLRSTPYLIPGVLNQIHREGHTIDKLELQIDGDLREIDSFRIKEAVEDLNEMSQTSLESIKGYKKNKNQVYTYSHLLRTADSLAHSLFRNYDLIMSFCKSGEEINSLYGKEERSCPGPRRNGR